MVALHILHMNTLVGIDQLSFKGEETAALTIWRSRD
jgi:hypothetical protein